MTDMTVKWYDIFLSKTPIEWYELLAEHILQADIKHAYYSVLVHPEDRHVFAFTSPGIGKLQPSTLEYRGTRDHRAAHHSTMGRYCWEERCCC